MKIRTKIVKLENDEYGIILDQEMLKKLNIDENTTFDFKVEGRRLWIIPEQPMTDQSK